jgi:drug/metabolite transporter (DMT)-like permease
MSLRDFGLLAAICMVWACNTVVSSLVIAHWGVPPLIYALIRFAIVTAVTFRWLLPAPRPLWRLILVAMCMGGGNFSLVFLGLKTATASSVSVVTQLGVPITTLLSMALLGEQIRWRRGVGIALSFVGVLVVVWDPHGLKVSQGLLFVLAGITAGSLGAVLMKQMEGAKPMTFQAWVGLVSLPLLLPATALFEHDQVRAVMQAGLPLLAAVLFSALVVSVMAHTAYYGLIQRYEANLVAPLTLMTPLFCIVLGVLITHDHFDGRMAFGTFLAMTGVLIVALRPNQVMPLLMAIRNRVQ